jgi:hypothetical protein
MSELMMNPCRPYPLYEVTSSGLTHTVSTTYGPLHLIFSHLITPYSFNIGRRVATKNFSLLTGALMILILRSVRSLCSLVAFLQLSFMKTDCAQVSSFGCHRCFMPCVSL